MNESVHFAYPTSEGVAWIDSYRGVVAARTGEEPRVVFSETGPDLVAVSGRRLVMGWTDKLFTFPAGSWTPRVTPTDEWIVALGASPKTALAFDSKAGLWRLESDGSWSQQESGIKDRVLGLAWYRGLWVAVGSTQGIELDEDDQDEVEVLRYGGTVQPHWVSEQRSPCLWWSTDGVKWQSGSLAVPGYNILTAVACLNGQWLAASVNGTLYGSADGKSWKQVSLLEKTNPWAEIRLVALGDEFLIRYGDERWWRSADGRDWQYVPLAAGARVDTPFMKDGQVYAVGQRKADRRVEVAPLIDFSVAPEPNAAELAAIAAKAAEDEKVRLAAVAEQARREAQEREKVAAAKVAAANAKVAAVNAKIDALVKGWTEAERSVHNESTMIEVCRRIAILAKLTEEKGDPALAKALLGSALKYTDKWGGARGFFEFGMSISNTQVSGFQKFLQQKTPAHRQWVNDLVETIRNPNSLPQNWPGDRQWPMQSRGRRGPQTGDTYDATIVRQRLAKGEHVAAYDLSVMYVFGLGVPEDIALADLWLGVWDGLKPKTESADGQIPITELARMGSVIESSYQAAWALHNQGGRLEGVALSWLQQAAKGGDRLAAALLRGEGDPAAQAAALKHYAVVRSDGELDGEFLVKAPAVPRPAFNFKYPPSETLQWSEAKIAENRPVFERRSQMSREIFALQAILKPPPETTGTTPKTPPEFGAATATLLEQRMQQIAATYGATWTDDLPEELRRAFVSDATTPALLYDRDTDFSQGAPLKFTKTLEAAVGLDGANPKVWYYHARVALWSGDVARARSEVALTRVLAKLRAPKDITLHADIERLVAELSLPDAVRNVRQVGVFDLNYGALVQATLFGKDYTAVSVADALALYGNLGRRLVVAWSRPDAADVVPLVYATHARELLNINFPKSRLTELQPEYKRAQALRATDRVAALALIEKLAAEAPLAMLLTARADVLMSLGRLDEARRDIEGALLLEPNREATKLLRQRLLERINYTKTATPAEMQAKVTQLLGEVRDSFRRGAVVTGKAKLDELLDIDPKHVDGLLLLAGWQADHAAGAVLATLRRAVQANPDSDLAIALLISQLAGTQQTPEAATQAVAARKRFPKSGAVDAAAAMAQMVAVFTSGGSDAPNTLAQLLKQLDALVAREPGLPIARAVRAQFRMMSDNQSGAADDMLRYVELSDYVPGTTLNQVVELLESLGREEAAKAVSARLPKS